MLIGELVLLARRLELTDEQERRLNIAAYQVRMYGRDALTGWRQLVSKRGWATNIVVPYPCPGESSSAAGICVSKSESSMSVGAAEICWGFTLPSTL